MIRNYFLCKTPLVNTVRYRLLLSRKPTVHFGRVFLFLPGYFPDIFYPVGVRVGKESVDFRVLATEGLSMLQ